MTKHEEVCNAPICVDCKDTTTVWYAGEKICSKLPLNSLQKKQKRINEAFKKGKFKMSEVALTPLYLNTHPF